MKLKESVIMNMKKLDVAHMKMTVNENLFNGRGGELK
jgi:hypothetical protein